VPLWESSHRKLNDREDKVKPELAPSTATHQPLISKSDVEALTNIGAAGPVLSLYLDTDQSNMSNINHGFETVFKNMTRKVQLSDEDMKREFFEDVQRVVHFLDHYRETRRALIVFCDASEDLFWSRELGVNVRNLLRWREKPYVQPLLELMDEHERYGVILTDRAKSRLMMIFLGEIEEYREAFATADVKHFKSPGMDHPHSQMQFQRKSDLHALWHLKQVARSMSRLVSKHEIDRLIIGGPVEATSVLYDLLPKALRTRVVSNVSLPVEASTAQVLEETLKIESKIEREREVELVESLITAAMKERKAVLGLENTLLALQESRVWQLVYAEGFEVIGGECTNCAALVTNPRGACVYCGKPVRAVDDLMQLAAERLIDRELKTEQVRGPAATRLREVGGIGAILHY
jgi:hypothetical protein